MPEADVVKDLIVEEEVAYDEVEGSPLGMKPEVEIFSVCNFVEVGEAVDVTRVDFFVVASPMFITNGKLFLSNKNQAEFGQRLELSRCSVRTVKRKFS